MTYARSSLSLRKFKAARMVTAHINGCQLCRNWRPAANLPTCPNASGCDAAASVADNGPAPDKTFYRATADWRGAGVFTPRERAAMALAEGTGEAPKAITADEALLADAHALFSDAEIIDLGYCIACWIGLDRMTHVLGLDAVCGLSGAGAGSHGLIASRRASFRAGGGSMQATQRPARSVPPQAPLITFASMTGGGF